MRLTKKRVTIANHLLIIALSCLICSCEYQESRQNLQLLEKARQLLNNKSDSSLYLLGCLEPEQLSQRDFARYQVLLVRAREQTGLDIRTDTFVFKAKDYLVKIKDEYAAMACFASASIYDLKWNSAKAMYDYLMAADYAENSNDNILKGAIYYNLARVYYDQRLYRESLDCLHKSSFYDDKAGIEEYRIYTLEQIAHNYLYLSQPDSAMYYLIETLNLKPTDSETRKRIYYHMALALRKKKEYKPAQERHDQAVALTKPSDSLTIGRLHLIQAFIFDGTGKNDSAFTYAYKAKVILDKSEDIMDLVDLYQLLSIVEQKNDHKDLAALYDQLYLSYSRFNEQVSNAVLKEHKRYQNETIQIIQGERNQLLLQRRLYFFIILSAVLLLVIGTYLFIKYIRSSKLKQAEERKKFEEEITAVKRISNDEKLQVIFQIKDIAVLNELVNARDVDFKKVRRQIKKVLKNSGWDDIYPVLNDTYEGLLDRFRRDYPDLTESEYRICCLSYAGFKTLEVSLILDEMFNTVQNKKTAIRKKTGMETRGSFREYFDQKYGRENKPGMVFESED